MPVLLLHTLEGVLDRSVPARHPPGKGTLLGDPVLHAFGNTPLRMFGAPPRRRAQPFNGDQPSDVVWINAGIAQRDHAPERMGEDRDRRELLLVDQLSEIVDITGHAVFPVGRPLTIAVPP